MKNKNHINQNLEKNYIKSNLVSCILILFIIFGLILSLGIWIIIKMHFRPDLQIDHLKFVIQGRLIVNSFGQYKLNSLNIQSSPQQLSIRYKNKDVFNMGRNKSFLIFLQNQGFVDSKNDSFYHLTDNYKKVCKNQAVQKISLKNEKIMFEGYFKDCQNSNYTLQMSINQKQNDLQIFLKQENSSSLYNRMEIKFFDNQASIYYGMGQQHSYLSLGRNRMFTNLVRQKGVGRGSKFTTFIIELFHDISGNYHTTYSPAPIWISNRFIGYFVNSFAYLSWYRNNVRVWDRNVKITLISKNNYKQIVSKISQYNGYSKIVPDWVNQGAIVGLQGGNQAVQNKYLTLKSYGAKITGLWLQDWSGKRLCQSGYTRLWWNWELDKDHYPNWQNMYKSLSQEGVSLLIYFNPHLVDPTTKTYIQNNYYKIALQNDCFIKKANGQVFSTGSLNDFQAYLIDFKNQKAKQLYKNMITKGIKQTGAKGMMVDFGESYPINEMHTNLQDSLKNHNEYPNLFLQTFHSNLEEQYGENNQFYTFTRAGNLYSPKHTYSMWAGDQTMDFDFHNGLPSCVTAMLSSGLIGFSNTHCDVGGYTYLAIKEIKFYHSYRTEELMTKWMQLGAFSPIFRTHQGNTPTQLQVYHNPNLAKQFSFYTNVFYILRNYRKQQASKSQNQGLPLTRSLFLQHPQNSDVAEIQSQFYLGQDLLVSPNIKQGFESKYYLPKGQWIDIWNGKQFEGCDCWRTSKGLLPPVYFKKSSIYHKQIVQNVKKLIEQFENSQKIYDDKHNNNNNKEVIDQKNTDL